MSHRTQQSGSDRARFRSRGQSTRSYRIAALYGLFFFLAAAAAPHHHVNSFEDLVTDGPSDSGIFVPQPATDPDPCFAAGNVVDDDPCLACFQNDYVAAASFAFVVARESLSFPLVPSPADPAVPQSVSDSPASRSPPRSARLT
ncbi:MAG TPA: hypothetical protein VGK70_10195 [Thermoanaerobaculia bacterium]|jgi:hypothetical protein